jgi:hypothetical protein
MGISQIHEVCGSRRAQYGCFCITMAGSATGHGEDGCGIARAKRRETKKFA